MALNCVIGSPIDFPGGKMGQKGAKNVTNRQKKRRICSIGGHQRLFVCYESLFFFKLSLLSIFGLSVVSSDRQVAPRPQKLPKLGQTCRE